MDGSYGSDDDYKEKDVYVTATKKSEDVSATASKKSSGNKKSVGTSKKMTRKRPRSNVSISKVVVQPTTTSTKLAQGYKIVTNTTFTVNDFVLRENSEGTSSNSKLSKFNCNQRWVINLRLLECSSMTRDKYLTILIPNNHCNWRNSNSIPGTFSNDEFFNDSIQRILFVERNFRGNQFYIASHLHNRYHFSTNNGGLHHIVGKFDDYNQIQQVSLNKKSYHDSDISVFNTDSYDTNNNINKYLIQFFSQNIVSKMDTCGRAEMVLDFGFTTTDGNRMGYHGQSDRCVPCLIHNMFNFPVQVLRHLGMAIIQITETLHEEYGSFIESLTKISNTYDNDSQDYRKANYANYFARKLGITSPIFLKWFIAEGVSIVISSFIQGHTDGENDNRDGHTKTIAYHTCIKKCF